MILTSLLEVYQLWWPLPCFKVTIFSETQIPQCRCFKDYIQKTKAKIMLHIILICVKALIHFPTVRWSNLLKENKWNGQWKGIPFDFIGLLHWFPVAVSQLVLWAQSTTGNYIMADSTDQIVGLNPKMDWVTKKKIIDKFFTGPVQFCSWLSSVSKTLMLQVFQTPWIGQTKFQTLHSGTTHWTLPVHFTLNDLYISKWQHCHTVLT